MPATNPRHSPRVHCVQCDDLTVARLFHVAPHDTPKSYLRCTDCGLVFEAPSASAAPAFDFNKPVDELTAEDALAFESDFIESLSVGDDDELYPAWQYDDSNEIARSLLRRVERHIRVSHSAESHFSLLEVGCAHGFLLREIAKRYPNATLVGVEPSPLAARRARAEGLDVRCGTTETVELESDSFDYAVCVGSLMLHQSPADTLAAMTRSLKPGGLLLTDVKNRRCAARAVARMIGRVPGTRRFRTLRNLASRSFEAMRFAFDRGTIGRMVQSSGCTIDEVMTLPPRRLAFANKSADANGLSGRVWRTLDRIDQLRGERAWIEVSARKLVA